MCNGVCFCGKLLVTGVAKFASFSAEFEDWTVPMQEQARRVSNLIQPCSCSFFLNLNEKQAQALQSLPGD